VTTFDYIIYKASIGCPNGGSQRSSSRPSLRFRSPSAFRPVGCFILGRFFIIVIELSSFQMLSECSDSEHPSCVASVLTWRHPPMPPGWSRRSHLGFSLPVIINGLVGKILTGNGNLHVWIGLKENLQWETMVFAIKIINYRSIGSLSSIRSSYLEVSIYSLNLWPRAPPSCRFAGKLRELRTPKSAFTAERRKGSYESLDWWPENPPKKKV